MKYEGLVITVSYQDPMRPGFFGGKDQNGRLWGTAGWHDRLQPCIKCGQYVGNGLVSGGAYICREHVAINFLERVP